MLPILITFMLLESTESFVGRSSPGRIYIDSRAIRLFSDVTPRQNEAASEIVESSAADAQKTERLKRMVEASQAAAAAYEGEKRRNMLIAISSGFIGAAAFAARRSLGEDSISLLHRMEAESVNIDEQYL